MGGQLSQSKFIPTPKMVIGPKKKLRFFNHKESEEYKSIKHWGESNVELKKRLDKLKRESQTRGSY